MIVAAFRQLTNEGRTRFETLAYVGIPLAIVVLLASFVTENKAVEEEPDESLEPAEGRYPIPELDRSKSPELVPASTVEVDRG
jgi:hypothetical protein